MFLSYFSLKSLHLNIIFKNVSGDIVLPKGADILVSIIQMHRNKKYWPNPLVFDPDRFLPENIKNCQSFYFAPFSDGPRNCIGKHK